MNDLRPDTVVLVHGLWTTPRSEEHRVAHVEARGRYAFDGRDA
ncbi:hypothetical protein [Nocardioides panacis]|nr:hypothetical protein [Nocardioides panacis]